MEKTKWKALFDVPILVGVAQDTMLTVSSLPLIYPERNRCYLPNPGELTILLSGSAKVCRRAGNKIILLNRLQAGSCIGFASLFSDSTPDTEVTFSSGASMLVIPRKTVEYLIDTDAIFARNIIAILSRKVRFLNSKIAGYTAKDSGEKLYRHMLSLPKDADGCVILGESMASLSRRLDMGRASLYRAVDALMAEGKLQKIGHNYKVVIPENKEETL